MRPFTHAASLVILTHPIEHAPTFYPNWCWSTINKPILPVAARPTDCPRIKLIRQLLELGGQGLGQDVIEPPQELVADDGGKRHRNLPRVPKKTGWCWYPQHLQHMEPETCGCPFTVDDCFSHWIRHNCWVPS